MADPPVEVTIVVSCYRQAAFLPAAVASARGQTVPCRVVVVDDGSDDGSLDIAEGLDVEVVGFPHRGALATFRGGVDLVDSPFYVLLNADDELDHRYVELTRPLIEDEDVGFVYTGVRLVGAQDRLVHVPAFAIDTLRFGNYVHAASLVRKGAYESVGGFDDGFADHHEDWALWMAMAAAGWRGVGLDEPLLTYRRHAEGSRNAESVRDIEAARWRLFRRHPRLYGARGLARLAASRAKLAVAAR
jgi:glycosyltransferase involved in cell wall biosynthesis